MPATAAPDPALLDSGDWQAALDFVGEMADAVDDGDGFARCGVERLARLAASELTTLSLCDLRAGRRHVIGPPDSTIAGDARASFDRHFHEHPLVLYHTCEQGLHVRRISDSVSFDAFQRSALYADYYRAIGIDHAVALPVQVSNGWLVGFVLNRRGRDFSAREVALLDQVRGAVGRLFRRTHLLEQVRQRWNQDSLERTAPPLPRLDALSAREHEVLRWVAAGKTDRDIATILAISHRTVHKHLQSVYAKFGVETRTAAVMRALAHA